MIKLSLLASMKLGSIPYLLGGLIERGLNKVFGPERGALFERGFN